MAGYGHVRLMETIYKFTSWKVSKLIVRVKISISLRTGLLSCAAHGIAPACASFIVLSPSSSQSI